MEFYDVIIIGGGPGGYTAAIYSGRAGLRVLVLDRQFPAGQMKITGDIDNYPGFPGGIDGYTLSQKLRQGAERFGVEIIEQPATAIDLACTPKKVKTNDRVYYGKSVIYAAGAEPRKLEVPEEKHFAGSGVHYCALCDGAFYRGKVVAVVGGGNSAAADALELSKIAKRVILIHRRATLRADIASQKKLRSQENIDFLLSRSITALEGDRTLSGLTLQNAEGQEEHIACDGLFVSIGRIPQTELLASQLELSEGGYIPADETTCTQVPGFFAVGDVRTKPLRQIVTATADGAVAAFYAQNYLTSV